MSQRTKRSVKEWFYMNWRLKNDDRLAKEYKIIKKDFSWDKWTKLSIPERKSWLFIKGLRTLNELF